MFNNFISFLLLVYCNSFLLAHSLSIFLSVFFSDFLSVIFSIFLSGFFFFSIVLSWSLFFLFITPELPQNRSVWGLKASVSTVLTVTRCVIRQWFVFWSDKEREKRETESWQISWKRVRKEKTGRGTDREKLTERQRMSLEELTEKAKEGKKEWKREKLLCLFKKVFP